MKLDYVAGRPLECGQEMSINGKDLSWVWKTISAPSFEYNLRKINGCLGFYIRGTIQGGSVEWTTDTGASKSII